MARQSAADKVLNQTFPMVLRGYDREAVDAWKSEIARLIDELEQQAPRDAVVNRALEEVGEQTSAILKQAHEAADEITSRSRSQADGRLRRAEGEADITVRDAEKRAQQLETDMTALWEERARLLEDMRQLADEVLGVADDALDRMAPPERDGGQTTDEVAVGPEEGAQAGSDEPTAVEPPSPEAATAERPAS